MVEVVIAMKSEYVGGLCFETSQGIEVKLVILATLYTPVGDGRQSIELGKATTQFSINYTRRTMDTKN